MRERIGIPASQSVPPPSRAARAEGNPTNDIPERAAKRRRKSLEERFGEKVDRRRPDECWLWTGAVAGSMNYGVIQRGGRGEGHVRAHRLSWEIANGPVPDGLVIDHLCGVPRCVNPRHLEPVTFRENVMRGNSMSARYARSTACAKGHPRKPEERGKRCGECRREWGREAYRQKKEFTP